MLSVADGFAQTPPPAAVTTVSQLNKLPREAAVQGQPAQLKGVVVCYDREWGQLYVRDETGTRYFSPQTFPQQLEAGQLVEVNGRTAWVDGGPAMADASLRVLGRQELPAAKRLRVSQLAGDLGEWVEVGGQVRQADTSRGRLGIMLHDEGRDCLVYVMGPSVTFDAKRLMGCDVRIRGINASRVVDGRLNPASVFAPGTNEVRLLGAPAVDPATLPVVSIDALLTRELGDWTNRLVHLNGLISDYTPGVSVVIRDPTGVLRAQITQITRAQPDERVDLWGFLTVSPTETTLTDAYFELAGLPSAAATIATPGTPVVLTNLPKVLTEISNIMRLPRQALAQRIPVELRGVITYADPEFHNGFLQHGSDAIYLDLTQRDVRAGQHVLVKGVTDPGGFAPQVNNVVVEILGRTNLPTPVKATLDDLGDGAMDSHWIEMQGVIRRAEIELGHLYLNLTTRKGKFRAVVPGIGAEAATTGLVDALVSVQGACGSGLNSRGQLSGITLHVSDLDQIQTLDAVPADPFAGETTLATAVSRYDATLLAGRRVKVSGVVTLKIPPSGFYLQDSSGGIRISTQQTNTLQVGDAVEVLGFPAIGDFSPYMEEASFRRTGTSPLPIPRPTSAENILLRGTNDGQVVTLEARLVQGVSRSAHPKFVLQDGAIIFTAHLLGEFPDPTIRRLKSGSLLRLTGVCSIQGGERHEPETFRLLLARSADVQLLQAPAWWTTRYTLMVVGGLLFVVMIGLAWIGSLRRRVRVQTEVIRRQLEEGKAVAETLAREKNLLATLIDHLPDHIFVKDLAGRFLLTNPAHARFFGLPSPATALGKTMSEFSAVKLSPRAAEADRKVLGEGVGVFNVEQAVTDATGEARWHSTTKVPLRDGTGALIGLVGISHDVTERKRAEAELEDMHKKLLLTSHQAGMAEVATSVLHNVGNVLNSVNVSAGLVTEKMRESKLHNIARLAALLAEHEADLAHFLTEDPRGRQVPAYLRQLAQHLTGEHAEIVREIEALTRNVEHIKEIVAMQQSYARVGGVVERVAVAELVADALQMNAGALERHGVQLVRDQSAPGPLEISVERHKVLQILVNVIRNAKYACDESGRKDKRIAVTVTQVDSRVRIAIADNGVGIAPEYLTRIFSHGFSTRKGGHGFGLHSAALAAKELGGSLHAQSDGPGQGATFILELPLAN